MLNVIRTKHARKILWVLSVVIIVTFVFWGGASFFERRNQRVLAKIGRRNITAEDFRYYYRMADLRLKLTPRDEQANKITVQDINNLAWEYYLLLWKAKQDKIEVSDGQVVETVTRMFSQGENGTFDQETYEWFLRRRNLSPRVFEEYIRNLLKIDMVFAKHASPDLTEEEIKDTYIKETQEAKISYIFIPFDKFKRGIRPASEQLESFYNKNRNSFKEEATVKLRYIAIAKDSGLTEQITAFIQKERRLDDVKNEFDLEIKETPFIGFNQPIEGLGWQPMVNQAAFILPKGKLSALIETYDGYALVEKVDKKEPRLPPLAEIKEKVTQSFSEETAKEKAKALAQDLITRLTGGKRGDMKKLARKHKVEFKQAGPFKYFGSIEGIGVDKKVSGVVFAMEKGQIHPEPLMLFKGACIVKLDDITPFDEETFAQKKEEYRNSLYREKSFREKITFVTNLQKEANLLIKQ